MEKRSDRASFHRIAIAPVLHLPFRVKVKPNDIISGEGKRIMTISLNSINSISNKKRSHFYDRSKRLSIRLSPLLSFVSHDAVRTRRILLSVWNNGFWSLHRLFSSCLQYFIRLLHNALSVSIGLVKHPFVALKQFG
ncbi:hypothetical protein NIES2135_27090 [Leptolyngbya boryana NIES-2135]|uniref:Uncharacterized protein n=1 Tax=Leptolyngbya boryana NIES-2135 TaxID=1973484 RepID=A0A1Z4JGJ3_LEPBY|nr:hypothetical protein NIES2135_27090 [Leptolyngbya boryana NIES-2135]